MPAIALESPRPGRSVLKLSLGITTAVVVCLLGAIFLTGAPAYSATVYTLTGSCGACNWNDLTKWFPNTGSYPGQATGDTALIGSPTLTVNVAVPNGVILQISGSATVNIPGTPATNSLQLEASSTFGSAGTITVNGGNLTLNSGATLTLTPGSSITVNSGTASNIGTFTNASTLTMNGGTFTNTGTIDNQSTFTMAGGTLTNNGTITVPPNGSFHMSGGTFTNNTAGGLTIQSLGSAGTAGDFTWDGGSITGPGTIVVQSGLTPGTLTLRGAASAPVLTGGQAINNNGILTYSSPAALSIISSAQINNAGTFSLTNDTAITSSDGTGKIVNSGSFSKNGGAATTAVGVTFDNNATVTFGSIGLGLAFNGGGTHIGTFNMPLTNFFQFNGAHTFNSGAAFTGTGPVSITGGTFQANTGLNLLGSLSNAGSLTFGGVTTQALSVAGIYTQTAPGSLTVRINGPTGGTNFDQVRVTGAATVAGTLNAALGYCAPNLQTFDIITDLSTAGDFGTKNLTGFCGDALIENPSPPSGTQVRLQALALADMAIVKTGPANVLDGQNATFSIKVSDGGPSNATNVVVTDTFSGGTFVSATPSGSGACSGVTSPFTCSWPGIANAGQETVSVVLKATAPGTLSNTATVSATETDPTPGNNSATANVTVTAAADLAVTSVSGLPNPVNAAQPETWQVVVSNLGPDAGTSAVVNISITTGTILSATATAGFTCTITTNSAQCTNPSFASGASSTITLNSTAPNQGGAWTMNANISSSTTDPVPGNNTGSGTVTVTAVADVGIVKTLPGSLVAGQNVTYNISVGNKGPSDASNVNVTDPTPLTPPGLTFVSTSCGALPCDLGTISAGGGTSFTVTFSVPSNATGTVTNTASVTANEVDPVAADNTSTITTAIQQKADLSVTKTGPSTAKVGSNITYTITVTNNGPSDAINVTLDDPTPPRLTFVSATAPCSAGFSSPCALGNMTSGQTITIQVMYTVLAGPPVTITNSAKATSPTTDPNTANNVGTASTSTGCPASAPLNEGPPDKSTGQPTNGFLAWSNVSATSYTVFFGPQGTGCLTVFGTTKGTAMLYQDLLPGTTYEWRVEASSPGCPTRSTACFTFTTCATAAPTLTSPINNATITSPATFSWSAVPGVRDYQLFVNSSLVTTTTATTATNVAIGSGPGTWFVVAELDPPCTSLTSQTGTFNGCDPNAVTIPSIIAQADSGQGYDLFWDVVPGATKYSVDEASDIGFTNPTTQSTTKNQLHFQRPVTTPTAFFYRVRAFLTCSNAFGPNSVVVRIVLSPVTSPSNPNVSVQAGNCSPVSILVHMPGIPDGTFPFTAIVDPQEKWLLSVTPSAGSLPPGGVDLTVSADPCNLSDGTHTGTVFMTVTIPSGGSIVNQGGFTTPAAVSISLVSPVKPQQPGPPQQNSLIIASTGHLDGINSRWASDVWLLNTALQAAKYQLTFTPDDTSQGIKQTIIDVGANSMTAFDDIVKTWYGVGSLGESSNGALEIRPLSSPGKGSPSGDDVSVSLTTVAASRAFNTASTGPTGTLGEFIGAIPFSSFVGRALDSTHAATILGLQQIAQSDSMRTNLGVMEASGQPASVLISVFDSAGKKLLDYPLALLGGQHAQLNSFLAQNKISLPDGRIEVQVVGGEGKITAYASVIDNKSGAPILISGVPLRQSSFDNFVLPGVADLNSATTAWRTDGRIFNPTPTAQNVTLTFYPQNTNAAPQTTSMTINAGEVKRLDNVLASVFGLTNTGGAIHVTTTTPVPLEITGRTYNLTSNGTFGQLTTAVTSADAIGQGDRPLNILQAEDSVRARTNLGFYEVTGKPAVVEITAFLPDSKISTSATVPMAANQFIQIPILQSLGLSNVYNARVSLRVVGGDGKIGAYGSVIDQATLDPMFIPAHQ